MKLTRSSRKITALVDTAFYYTLVRDILGYYWLPLAWQSNFAYVLPYASCANIAINVNWRDASIFIIIAVQTLSRNNVNTVCRQYLTSVKGHPPCC